MLEEISTIWSRVCRSTNWTPKASRVAPPFAAPAPTICRSSAPWQTADAFTQAYAALSKDARQVPDVECPWLDGLYINSGHGSRGLITAPLSGELLAAWLDDEPLPLPRSVAEACHPNRFALRRLIRRTNA